MSWDELFAAVAEIGFDGRLVLESFVYPDPEMTRLAALWRDVAPDPEEPLREGLPFLRAGAEEHGLNLGRGDGRASEISAVDRLHERRQHLAGPSA